jgi:hypothetical protein
MKLKAVCGAVGHGCWTRTEHSLQDAQHFVQEVLQLRARLIRERVGTSRWAQLVLLLSVCVGAGCGGCFSALHMIPAVFSCYNTTACFVLLLHLGFFPIRSPLGKS